MVPSVRDTRRAARRLARPILARSSLRGVEKEFNFHCLVWKLDASGVCAIQKTGRQESRDVAVDRLHVALDAAGGLANGYGTEELRRRKANAADRWGFSDFQARTNSFMPSAGGRTSRMTVFTIPPRNVALNAGDQFLGRGEGVHALLAGKMPVVAFTCLVVAIQFKST